MEKSALIVLIIALGAIIFEFAVFSVIKSSSPWIKALPTLVPFIGLLATVFFSATKDNWLVELAKSIKAQILGFPLALYLCTILAVAVSIGFGHFVWQLSGAKEGLYTIQVVRKDDVPDQYLSGLPVFLDHKLKTESLKHDTDENGKANFEVDLSDVFAVRIQSPENPRRVFVVSSEEQVSDKTKKGFKLVKLDGIPEKSWITTANSTIKGESFAQFPEEFFRFHNQRGNIINVDNAQANFPFTLPDAETVIIRSSFSVGFSPLLRLPRWVAYKIVPRVPIARDRENFIADPVLPSSYQASSLDYKDNPFDRASLARRSDMSGLGKKATLEVSHLSNVIPLLNYANQKIYFALREYASNKATTGRDVYVIRGPIYEPLVKSSMVNVTLIGQNLIPVPTHFFQILYVAGNGIKSIEAHIVPNKYIPFENKDLAKFRVKVQDIKQKTGLQFDEILTKE
jgi:DNA/RNA endonuclease G (NUC1)